MGRLTVHETMPNFTYATPFADGLMLEETLQRVPGKTALVFLRYYGCPICQLDLHEYAEVYEQISATGGQLLVVLQSDPKNLAERIEPGTFPYDIICDPEMKLYQMLSVDPAASMLKMMSFSAVKKVVRSAKRGFKHGDYEGNEQQLPAAFIMTKDRKLTFVRYGKDAGDVPTSDELITRLKDRNL